MNEVVITGISRTAEIAKSPVPMITVNTRELQQNLTLISLMQLQDFPESAL